MLNLTDNERNWAKTTAARFEHKLRAVRERYRHGLVSHTEVLDAETLGSRAT